MDWIGLGEKKKMNKKFENWTLFFIFLIHFDNNLPTKKIK